MNAPAPASMYTKKYADISHDVPETLSLHDKIVLSILAGSVALFTLTIFTDRSSRPVKSDDGFERSYETYCSIFSAATFNWVTPTIRLGNKKRLDPEDLSLMPTGDQAKIAYDRFKAEEREDRSLLKNLFWHHRELVLYQFMYVILANAFIFAGPLCLNMLVQYFQNGRTAVDWTSLQLPSQGHYLSDGCREDSEAAVPGASC
ncbi:hypothetical protein GQ42DRAFT_159143 [Ramicandelaber brevisporus]|nr:hypothetical protein GQ42DRAFT_159143 [Ramicandelaber brevisporus]